MPSRVATLNAEGVLAARVLATEAIGALEAADDAAAAVLTLRATGVSAAAEVLTPPAVETLAGVAVETLAGVAAEVAAAAMVLAAAGDLAGEELVAATASGAIIDEGVSFIVAQRVFVGRWTSSNVRIYSPSLASASLFCIKMSGSA